MSPHKQHLPRIGKKKIEYYLLDMNDYRPFNSNRSGADELSVTLIILGILLILTYPILTLNWLRITLSGIGIMLILLAVLRSFSTNVAKRRAENDTFLSVFRRGNSEERRKEKEERKARKQKRRENEKTYAYFFCPKCKKELRVPRGKGKIRITCPNCGEQFIRKT